MLHASVDRYFGLCVRGRGCECLSKGHLNLGWFDCVSSHACLGTVRRHGGHTKVSMQHWLRGPPLCAAAVTYGDEPAQRLSNCWDLQLCALITQRCDHSSCSRLMSAPCPKKTIPTRPKQLQGLPIERPMCSCRACP